LAFISGWRGVGSSVPQYAQTEARVLALRRNSASFIVARWVKAASDRITFLPRLEFARAFPSPSVPGAADEDPVSTPPAWS
jgi:hypothetical protein